MLVLWLESLKVVCIYQSDIHANKLRNFIFWKGHDGRRDLIIACHSKYNNWCKSEQVFADHLRYKLMNLIPRRLPDGVGEVHRGTITSWKSDHFNILTPAESRPFIEEALGLY